jgi:hypothetical protein
LAAFSCVLLWRLHARRHESIGYEVLGAPLTSILATLSQQSGKIPSSPEKKPVPYTGIGEHPDLNDGVRTNIRLAIY